MMPHVNCLYGFLSGACIGGVGFLAAQASARANKNNQGLPRNRQIKEVSAAFPPKPPISQNRQVAAIDAKSALKNPRYMTATDAQTARDNLKFGTVEYVYPLRTTLRGLSDFMNDKGGVAEGDWVYYMKNPHQVGCAFIFNENRDYRYTHNYPRWHHPDHPKYYKSYDWHDECAEERWQDNDDDKSEAEVMVGPPPTQPRILQRLSERIKDS